MDQPLENAWKRFIAKLTRRWKRGEVFSFHFLQSQRSTDLLHFTDVIYRIDLLDVPSKRLADAICRALQDSRRIRRKAINQFISSVAFGAVRFLISQQGH